MAERLLLALDQGTTSTRAILFDADGALRASAQQELPQHYPQPGWVEHDPEEIWDSALRVIRRVLINAKVKGGDVAAIGITNQRETTVIWDRETGAPIHRAIVWQDRRTAEWCRRMAKNFGDAELGQRTGLLFDAYFSGSKIAWLLDNVAGARRAANQGKLAFGTIDTFLLWRLTGGKVHATDATNASRTMLFNLETLDWDDTLLREFDIPRSLLPEIRDSAADFGEADKSLFGAPIPVRGIAGDQHAATFGQACFNPGMVKSTYGTGCFVLVNTGTKRVRSKNRMLTTLAWRLRGKPSYALEGSIFISGAAIQWLRDGLKVIAKAGDTEAIAAKLKDTGGVYLVPAFTGLGAPYWDPDARGAILGLTRATGQAEIVRAALEATAYQTRDLIDAMSADLQGRNKDGVAITALRVDGGMVVNNWLMQFLADQVGVPVERPAITETTALGAAFLAGLGAGVYRSTDEIARKWRRDRRFETELSQSDADLLYEGWKAAVARVRTNAEPVRKKRG